MIEFEDDDGDSGGGAGWLATFADLMSLLMCFFVLLLSFSEMDAEKYKQLAGSMKMAFGVQDQIKVKSIPKGTSIIAREFTPGRPQATVIKKLEQSTYNSMHNTLDNRVRPRGRSERDSDEYADSLNPELPLDQQLEQIRAQTALTAAILRELLEVEIREGKIDVLSAATVVTVRIRERGSFGSGSDEINAEFLPVMATLRSVLGRVSGSVAVEGHTDNIPISNARFRSNWDLSAARALAVAHELMREESVRPERFMVIGYADSRPLATNDSFEGRGLNRRVAIVMRHGLHDTGRLMSAGDAALVQSSEGTDHAADS